MKLFDQVQSREEYIDTQVRRSKAKFVYCNVSARDVFKYKKIIARDRQSRFKEGPAGPVLCLGTRNSREVDVFRTQFFGSSLVAWLSQLIERHTDSFFSPVPLLESINQSRLDSIDERSVVGVEINPQAARPDIYIGSFDDMPQEWHQKFLILFSNSFDQSQDPIRTAREWKRVLKPAGYLIFCYVRDTEPMLSDPVGCIDLKDIVELFGGEIVYFCSQGSQNAYTEAIIRLPD